MRHSYISSYTELVIRSSIPIDHNIPTYETRMKLTLNFNQLSIQLIIKNILRTKIAINSYQNNYQNYVKTIQ